MSDKLKKCLFSLGTLCATPDAIEVVTLEQIREALIRHIQGDWGEVCREDWLSNNRALEDGTRLLSAYRSQAGDRFWIITEADRSVTTVLLPEEY